MANNIDYNIDLTKEVLESEVLEFVSSVNIPCLLKDIKASEIESALEVCSTKKVAIGALVGFDTDEEVSGEELEAILVYQIGALQVLAHSRGYEIEHVRPFGALYKKANEEYETALTIARAMKRVNKWLIYYGGNNEITQRIKEEAEIRTVSEIQLGKNIEESIKRLKNMLETPSANSVESVHFDMSMPNIMELLKESQKAVNIQPANYNKVEASGWL